MYPDQIDDDYIKDIQEGLERILEEIMKGEHNHERDYAEHVRRA